MTLPDDGRSPAPRLTRLELHGFKSFATRTVFAFEAGITAIVGPNGSGKSNIADAVRWVLGEQGHGALRAKRTEDVIFAGGQGRSPAGLAEVTLTFDNSERWLPTEFAEVTVARRAFRSGENQYLINGRRVRLKDVAHLTASLGQSHVVVGQGLVDAALSQRAEERRGLFEHAADLAGLRLKVAEANRNLAETEANSTRLTDLLTELEPRLKTLERVARQAREWRGLRDRLREVQGIHYGRLLVAARREVATATGEAARAGTAVGDARATVEQLRVEGEARGQALADARQMVATHDARRQALDEQVGRAGHERDLARERHAALRRRQADMTDTQSALDERVAGVAAEQARLKARLEELEAETVAARRAVATSHDERAAIRRLEADQERQAEALVKRLAGEERQLADLARRRALLEQRRETDAAERERAQTTINDRAARIERLREELTAAEATASADDADLAALAAVLADLTMREERARGAAVAARTAEAEAERRLGQATTRLDVLRRLHESGAGLYTGVRETLAAARSGKLEGVRGTVAELLDVPAAFDTAIEVALGGHLQDIVVEEWAQAEAAIAHLKRASAGRATFQPLDTVRGNGRGAGGGSRSLPRQALTLPGVDGVAGDLVRAAAELGGVVDALLGRTLVVADLPTARTSLPLLPLGWSAVTRAGELARSGGSVTGGAAVRESGVLGRERELRELPGEVRRLERARDDASVAQAAATDVVRQLTAERQATEAKRAGRVAAREERRGHRQRLADWLQDVRIEQEAAQQRLNNLDEGAAASAIGLDALEKEAATQAAAVARVAAELTETRGAMAQTAGAVNDAERLAAAAGQRLAALEERLRAERRGETALRAEERGLADELAVRSERMAGLEGERAAMDAAYERLATEAAGMTRARDRLVAERPPLQAVVARIEAEVTRLTRQREQAEAALLEREREHGTSDLAVERAIAEHDALRRRIGDDLEMDDPERLLETGEGATGVDGEETEEAALEREREIGRLRERLRRVGYVGEDAVAEFERESAHHAYLRNQLADVEGAAATLHDLLAGLQTTMRARFDETFTQVAEVFAGTFRTLFGGGSARLILTTGNVEDGEGENGPPGIDIIAQPPGKRLQSLALLSGGERALTAAALLIAILQVNPAPFCLLDEVDAALDESNVVRFREQLRSLATETQVIVVTHNPGTIEIADTLYGVSMGDDGVSQVLSLRLTESGQGAEGGGERGERTG